MVAKKATLARSLALLASVLLLAIACGDDSGADESDPVETDTTDPDETNTTEPTEVTLEATFRGVTEDTINIGVTMLDFPLLVELGLSPAGWGDQQAVYQALIDDINENGGINGRMLHAEYRAYSPISATSADEVCSALTQDFDLFAVIGGFLGPAGGTSDPCITGLNETILVGGEINAEELAASVAPWYHAGPTVEEQTVILLDLLESNGYTEGRSIYVVGGVAAEAQFEYVMNELDTRGLNVVGSAILGANDGDTVDQDSEMGPIMERLSASGADTVFIFGNPAALIRGIADAGLDTQVEIWTNNGAGLNNLGASITDLSVADGTVTSGGLTDAEIWEQELFQTACVEPVAARVNEALLQSPDLYARDDENWFNATRLACQDLELFRLIAEAAGPDLTQETFVAGAESLISFAMPTSPESSLGPDKITPRDQHRLLTFDSTAGDGMAVPVTELMNLAGG